MSGKPSWSKRERRRWLHRPDLCGCWHCMTSKAKLHAKPRTTATREAIRREMKAEDQ